MNKNKRKKIIDLFMQEDDEKALKKLYDFTNDSLILVLLKWKKLYVLELDEVYSPQFEMYEDMIEYVFNKYKLK